MNNSMLSLQQEDIQNRILRIRGRQVMLDSHLAELFGVELKRLNEQVKRNGIRFPEELMFQMTENELSVLRSQNATLEQEYSMQPESILASDRRGKHRKYLPFVFTEQGVAMLSTVLRSETAIKVSIQIMNAFVDMRKIIQGNILLCQRIRGRCDFKTITCDIFCHPKITII
jgi:phage regulator Rha-like protein